MKEEQNAQIQKFLELLDGAQMELQPLGEEKDLRKIAEIREGFQRRVEDFYRENRQLNIGVVGQVKAGKSSFLNTLLFGGREVLPKASTPKTAALTRMEYAEENAIEVEYYTPDEWRQHLENAEIDLDDDVYMASRELVGMVEERVQKGLLDVETCLHTGAQRLEFDTYGELVDCLNSFVSVDGVYTPLVKSVSLYLNNEQFRGLSIVDTPGLNDPVVSRTVRTREFISVCDVVFFLSQSGSFLDAADWSLLSAQLPENGVKRLVLIASKYDSALRDVLRKSGNTSSPFARKPDKTHAGNIPDACQIAGETLRRRARQQVSQHQEFLRQRGGGTLAKAIESCKDPILFSTMACNMSRKPQLDYSPEELSLARKLNEFSTDLQADLQRIGDIQPIQRVFDQIVAEKEQILQEKSETLASSALEALRSRLDAFAEEAGKKAALLSDNDKGRLMEQKQGMEEKQNSIRAAISDVFSSRTDALKTTKAEGIAALRSARSSHGNLTAQTGTREEEHSRKVSDRKWYNPFSWFRSHTEYYTVTKSYTYFASSEAAESLGRYARDAANQIERAFTNSVNLSELRQKLCAVIVNCMDMGDARFDSAYFRLKVNELVDAISFPTVQIDASRVVEQKLSGFSGQVSDEAGMERLQNALQQGLDSLFQELCSQFDRECGKFLDQLQAVNREFQEALLSTLREEFETLMEQLGQKEQEISRLEAYQARLAGVRKRLEVF